jgi:aspartate/methionine/tyrosine aminotransferase
MFDIHPGREKEQSAFNQYVRFSFGPEEENVKRGLERITELIKLHQ